MLHTQDIEAETANQPDVPAPGELRMASQDEWFKRRGRPAEKPGSSEMPGVQDAEITPPAPAPDRISRTAFKDGYEAKQPAAAAATDGVVTVSYTLVRSVSRLTKTATIDADGKIKKSGGIKLYDGEAHRIERNGTPEEILTELAAEMQSLNANEAYICAPPPAAKGQWRLSTSDAVTTSPGAIARTKENFKALSGPTLVMLDFDMEDFSPELLAKIEKVGSIPKVLAEIYPAFADAARLYRNSASSAIRRKGAKQTGPVTGVHQYQIVTDGRQVEEKLSILNDRGIAAGYAWARITASGTILTRGLFDVVASCDSSRLCYEANPEALDDRLEIDSSARPAHVRAGGLLDLSRVDPLTAEELEAIGRVKADLERKCAARAAAAREQWQKARIEQLVARGTNETIARKIVANASERHSISGDFEILLDDGRSVTARDILASPPSFHGLTCPDPFEPEYGAGRNLAIIYSDRPTIRIHSLAHGGIDYILEHEPDDWFEELPEPISQTATSDSDPHDIFDHALDMQLREPPAAALPGLLERWSRSEARRKGTPVVFAAAAAVATIGSAIGNSLRIQVRANDPNFTEPASLWLTLVADPGSAKSATISSALRPLREVNDEWTRKDAQAYATWLQRNKRAERSGKGAEPEPPLRRTVVDDITTEAQLRIHRLNPRGLMRATDELAGVMEAFGAYKKSGGGDRAAALRMFDGDSITSDRVGSGSIHASCALMGILAGTQPDKLRSMVHDMQADGLLQRFLFILDEGGRTPPIDEPPDTEAASNYRSLVRHLTSAEYLFAEPIKISTGGRAHFTEFLKQVDALKDLPGGSAALVGHLAKWEKIAARLILIFHAIEQHEVFEEVRLELAVDPGTAERALRFCRFLLCHSLKFYRSYFDPDPVHEEAVGLAGFLLTRPELKTVNRRDVYQARSNLKGPQNRRRLFQATRSLEEAAWLTVSSRDAEGPTEWKVSSKIHERFADRATFERAEREKRHEAIRRAGEARRAIGDVK